MDFTDACESRPLCSERLSPQIGPNHQVTMPPLKQSARIASMEYINRDQWYACGLPVPITYIATPRILRKCRNHVDQDKSISLTSTTTLRTNASHFVHQDEEEEQHELRLPREPKFPFADVVITKDSNSCASSSKEASSQSDGWRRGESSARTVLADASRAYGSERQREAMMDNVSGQSELKSSITSEAQGSTMVRKKKKRRSCWQTLKRKGNKKSKRERERNEGRWAPLQSSEKGAAARQARLGALAGGSCFVLPGCHPDSWSKGEVAAFTLGLYLFNKDFSAIERFLESKKMSDILHFYYGEFYRSPAFLRWAGSKNSRNRKCVHGPRILQGWRQDELLRRLHPHFSDACKDGIPEVVQSFNERHLTVEGLAMELKAAVGLEVLVRCVGIGMSKWDLTAVHGDPAKQVYHPATASGRMEVASVAAAAAAAAAKGCPMLSKEETLECLAGDVRFSKTRSHSLFWDSVWPRLLSHGWQSMDCEAPALGWPGSRSSLAFLRPGVEKIVKGLSEKGIHYFDSASEVLEAVAVDPSLLDGSELTGDTMEGSDDQEEDDMEGWSDDMFETLDMHRLRPTKGRVEAGSKEEHQVAFKVAVSSPSEEHAAQESSESSPVDIDLNRPLAVLCSKPDLDEEEEIEDNEFHPAAAPASNAATHHQRFPIEEIDLNLPPVDHDCNFTPFAAEIHGEVSADMQTAGSSYFVTPTIIASSPLAPGPSVSRRSLSLMEEINLNDPLPLSDLSLMEGTGIDMTYRPGPEVQHPSTKSVGRLSMSAVWIAEAEAAAAAAAASSSELSLGISACDGAIAWSNGFSNPCRCLSRKRSLDYREREREAQGEVNAGKELVPIFKKRDTRYNFPFRLDGIGTPTLFFSVQTSKTADWSRIANAQTSGWKNDFRVGLSKILSIPPMPEKIAPIAELQSLKCKVVELDEDMEEAVDPSPGLTNRARDWHVQRSLSSKTAQVTRLKCHFSEAECEVPSSNSRSKLQRLPRKFTISLDSGSDGNHLTKIPGEGRCIDWKWSRGGGIMTTSCSFNSHGSPVAEECYAEDGRTMERTRSDFHHDGSWCMKGDDFDPKKSVEWGGHRKASSGALGMKENVPEIDRAKSLPEGWEVPSYTSTPCAPDSCHHRLGDLPRPGARSRGIRSRLHTQSVPSKTTGEKRIFSFGSAKKRSSIEDREFEVSKKMKRNDAAYSLRNREMSEHELLITLCSMQKHVNQGAVTEAVPKVKGKRSPRIRRRNFNFKFIIFESGGQADDVEEGLSVQPCTSQGPWQPTCHLPSTDKIQRTPKLRRRRSGLPCKGSCVVAAPAAINPVPSGSSKSGNSASKGLPGSRLPGQTLPAEEEAVPLNWPVHDVRFSLRRASSDGVIKTDRQNGRKIPARWNHFSVC